MDLKYIIFFMRALMYVRDVPREYDNRRSKNAILSIFG